MIRDQDEFVIRSQRVLLPDEAEAIPASIIIGGGLIRDVVKKSGGFMKNPPENFLGESSDSPAGFPIGISVLDVGNSVVMAGLVDTHAHINEPGRTEWEGFQTATRAAAAGGITTVIDMPLNSIPPTTTAENLEIKARAAQGICLIDYGFWGGLIPQNIEDLPALLRGGVMGVKSFLIDSGVPEFPLIQKDDLRRGMAILAKAGIPLLVHAELENAQTQAQPPTPSQNRAYSGYLKSRPARWEVDAIKLVIELMRETGCRCHIVHLSAADALGEIKRAKEEGLPLTVETCPHYLTFAAEEIADGATHFKCAPPIREKANREKLWQALADGVIDMIVSDHSPCTPHLKGLEKGDFSQAWGGIAGIQVSLAAVWTEMKKKSMSLASLTKWMSQNPSKLAGLDRIKGQVAKGFDADLVVWNPESEFTLNANMIHHRHPLTPYSGRSLFGLVEKTFVSGKCVYDENKFTKTAAGRRLTRLGNRK